MADSAACGRAARTPARDKFRNTPTCQDGGEHLNQDARDVAQARLNDSFQRLTSRRAQARPQRQPAAARRLLARGDNPGAEYKLESVPVQEEFSGLPAEEFAAPRRVRAPGPAASTRGLLRRPDPGRRRTHVAFLHPTFSSSAVPPAGPGFARHVSFTQLANLYQGSWLSVPVPGRLWVVLPRDAVGSLTLAVPLAKAIMAAPRANGYVLVNNTYVPVNVTPLDQQVMSSLPYSVPGTRIL